MDLEKKLELLSVVESYWDMLPPEIKEMILKYKESQELIKWRENLYSQRVCREIEAYGQMRLTWFIGPIQCKPRVPKRCECQPRCFFTKIYGHYWNLDGERKKAFLSYGFWNAIPQCHSVKNGIQYQTNPSHSLSVCGMKLSL